MNSLKFPLAVAILLGSGVAALAESSSGTVMRFDRNPHTMTFTTGEVITLPASLMIDRINSGDKVTVTWALEGSNQIASKVTEFETNDGGRD